MNPGYRLLAYRPANMASIRGGQMRFCRRERESRAQGFLVRLARDKRAATLPMMAVAFIPLAGMVGGALDISRLYLVKTRLQQACDAGALAARRTMDGDTLTTAAETQGENVFKANLRTNDYGAENVEFELANVVEASKATGRVAGAATAQVEPSLMRLFGFRTITMSAACQAELNLTNTDVMFVLDLTGSMACLPSDSVSTCTAYGNGARETNPSSGPPYTQLKTGSRLQGLRDAVTAFHATLDNAVPDDIRLRFGFVPYSSNVNVQGILPSGSLVTGTRTYQSRVANMKTARWRPTTTAWSGYNNQQSFSSPISWASCQKYQDNEPFTQGSISFKPDPAGNPAPEVPDSDTRGGSKPDNVSHRQYAEVTTSYSNNKTCTRKYRTATTSYSLRGYGFTSWTYLPVDYNLSSTTLSLVESVPTTDTAYTTTSGSWNSQELAQKQAGGTAFGLTRVNRTTDGCIEERLTGMDDIDDAATNNSTRWAPTWRWLTYIRNSEIDETTSSSPTYAIPSRGLPYNCTKSAQRLKQMSAANVTSFLYDLNFVAMGYTYHDIGMIWGARLMAQNGVFSADHAAASNGRPTARHIIFMTDGDMDPDLSIYSPFGPEKLSRRRLPTGTLSDTRLKAAHNNAFLAACAAARADNITIWVVAFGQSLTTELEQCADDETRTFESTDSATLTSQFQQIAARIAELRLSR